MEIIKQKYFPLIILICSLKISINCYGSYEVGDLLLKIRSERRTSSTDTNHHVMLVCGKSKNNKPIIAHMTFSRKQLKIEELRRAKGLILIRPQWSNDFKKNLTQILDEIKAQQKEKYFVITPNKIREQKKLIRRNELSGIFFKSQLKSSFEKIHRNTIGKLPSLHSHKTVLSCHEFVVKILHYNCFITGTLIPDFLKIHPEKAWSFVLYDLALHYNKSLIKEIRRI